MISQDEQHYSHCPTCGALVTLVGSLGSTPKVYRNCNCMHDFEGCTISELCDFQKKSMSKSNCSMWEV